MLINTTLCKHLNVLLRDGVMVVGGWLDEVILEGFSNHNYSMIHPQTHSFDKYAA